MSYPFPILDIRLLYKASGQAHRYQFGLLFWRTLLYLMTYFLEIEDLFPVNCSKYLVF